VEPSAPSQEDRLYEVKFVAAINLGMFTIISRTTPNAAVFPAAYNKQCCLDAKAWLDVPATPLTVRCGLLRRWWTPTVTKVPLPPAPPLLQGQHSQGMWRTDGRWTPLREQMNYHRWRMRLTSSATLT
jgi:hypothetical protein